MSDHKHETCRWTEDRVCECWDTGCSRSFVFVDEGGPTGNRIRFCPYCGKPIEAVPYVPEEEEAR